MNKVYLAVDKDGTEVKFTTFPERIKPIWRKHIWISDGEYVILPTGTIRKLIGRDLTWENEPVELTEENVKPKYLADVDWLKLGSTNEYSELKKRIAYICRDVTAAGCIDEICINDIVVTFRQFGYEILKSE